MKLDDTGADGFVPMRSLGSDYFIFDEARRAVVGRSTGEMHRLGDAVEVKLVDTDRAMTHPLHRRHRQLWK